MGRGKRTQDLELDTKRGSEFKFGEAKVVVEEAGEDNVWRCLFGGEVIGFVKYSPPNGSKKTHGFSGFNSSVLEEAEMNPSTDVNCYSTLRNAAQAVLAKKVSGRTYTYLASPIAILDNKVVIEETFRNRRTIKPSLGQ